MNKSLIANFINLAKIDSPTGQENELIEFLINNLIKKVDFITQDSYRNIYARLDGKGEPIFFSFHLDTVEPGRNIKPKINNKHLVASTKTILGADNKSAIACVLETIKYIKLKQLKHNPLELIFTRSEEVGNYGAINFDYSLLQARRGFCFDSSNPVGTIVIASPFYERFDLEIIGQEAHASKPEEAINALTIFNDILNNITLGRLDKETIFNIGVIKSGYTRNTVPGIINIKGEIRSFNENKLEKHKKLFFKKIETIISRHHASHSIEFIRENSGYQHNRFRNFRIINQLKTVIKNCGLSPCLINSWGVSDANIFMDKGLICFNLGNGVEFPHTTRERIKLSEMENLVKLMVKLLTF